MLHGHTRNTNIRVPISCDDNTFVFKGYGNDGIRAFSSVQHGAVVVDEWSDRWGVHDGFTVYCDYESDGYYYSGVMFSGMGLDAFQDEDISVGSLPRSIGWNSAEDSDGTLTINFFPDAAFVSSAISDFLSSYTPPVPVFNKNVTIPIGYAAFLKASGTLTMRCTFPSNSALFSGTSGWWGETHQTIGSSSALPDSNFQFPVADALQIVWARDSALSPLGILGTTKHAYSEHTAFSPWTVIYNPVYKNVSIGANANDRDSFNGPISVSGMIGEFRLYPLSSSLSSSGIVGDGSSDDYIDVTIDPETGEPVYTDPSGNVVHPPSAGGNTLLPEAASNTSLIQRIVGILNDLVQRIEGIFSVAYQAISSLVGLAGPLLPNSQPSIAGFLLLFYLLLALL